MNARTPLPSLILACVALTVLCAAAPVRSQERPDTSRLTPVVVTASRVPFSQVVPTTTATRLEGEDLRERGIRLVSDALSEVPGLTVVRGGSTGAVTSVFLRGGESDYVQVLVDGVVINEPGGSIDFANLTTEDIDRIEVVRGPASVLYGSEAVSGVVQIFTRRGGGAPRLSVGARSGSQSTREFDASVDGRASVASYALGAARTETDGILAFNNEHRRTSISGSIGTMPGASTDVRASAKFTDGRYHFPTSSGGEVSDSNQFSFERRLVAGLDAGRRLGSRAAGHITLSSSTLDGGTDDDPDNIADTTGSFASRSTRESFRQGADFRIDVELPGSATLSSGLDLEWERERTTFRSEHGTFGPFRGADRDDRRWNRGYYGQLLGNLNPALSYTLGARLDDNEAFGDFFTYRAGAGVRLSPRTTIRAALGTAFKAPVFYEITGAGFADPNPRIKPERSRSWDAGVEHAFAAFGRDVSVGATWFDQSFRDMIQYFAAFDGPGLGQYQNVAGARSSGVELEARALATDRLTILANTTVLDAQVLESRPGSELAFEGGERLIRRPGVAAHLSAKYRFLAIGTFGATIAHVGRRDDIDFTRGTRVRLDSHTTLAASLGIPVGQFGAFDSVMLRLSADNLLDAEYSAIAGYRSPGRTILVGATASFVGR